MEERDVQLLILGTGSAGLLVAKHLYIEMQRNAINPSRISVIGRWAGGPSRYSSWYVAQHDPTYLQQRILDGLGKFKDKERVTLVEYIAHHHLEATEEFAANVIEPISIGGVKRFEVGFCGVAGLTGYAPNEALAGNKILSYLEKEIKKNGVRTIKGTITGLKRNEKGYLVTYMKKESYEQEIYGRKIVIASGGLAHKYEFATSPKVDIPSVLELARDNLAIKVEALDHAVYFPFAVKEEGYRQGSLLPPSFMTRAEVLLQKNDGTLEDFLSSELKTIIASGNYRPQFPELTRIFCDINRAGKKVIVKTRMYENEFKEYLENDHYGYVFRRKKYEEVLKGVEVAPAYHATLGGIVVDKECRTSDQNVFAIGEAALIYGEDRLLGGEHLATITLAPLVAKTIVKDLLQERMI